METISLAAVRRLALARAGLLRPERTGLPKRAAGRGKRAVAAAHAVIRRFGYLQLDTIAITGARTQGIVLHSRLDGFDPSVAEELLVPGAPLFEYWGHEASWLPIELYPLLEHKRKAMHDDRFYKEVMGPHRKLAKKIRNRIAADGPIRSADLSGDTLWRGQKAAKYVAQALWSVGELAIRERRAFQRVYDLPERVIPADLLTARVPTADAMRALTLLALAGHGWAREQTILDTWRIKSWRKEVKAALAELEDAGEVLPCSLDGTAGWIRREDRELAARLARARPNPDRAVVLSPFDPVLWDRDRVRRLFGFEQVLEIYKPAAKRVYGYYVLPVLAGEHLVARADLKAHRKKGRLTVLSSHFEESADRSVAEAALESALRRYSDAVSLELERP